MTNYSPLSASGGTDLDLPPLSEEVTELQRELGSYTRYSDAQRTVDFLSDRKFPVQFIQIVGQGLSTVETVRGRMTKGKAALLGAASGAWFGLFVGLLVGLFAPGAVWVPLVLLGLVFGAVWGAAFGFVGHWATRGQRDFSSTRTLSAARYAVMVRSDQYLDAERLLAEMR